MHGAWARAVQGHAMDALPRISRALMVIHRAPNLTEVRTRVPVARYSNYSNLTAGGGGQSEVSIVAAHALLAYQRW